MGRTSSRGSTSATSTAGRRAPLRSAHFALEQLVALRSFSEAYAQFFGTTSQPNIVARTTVQVAALANPGFLIEVEATAAKVGH
jgi:enamine deaminase RidA (YjgF/YER057c/UK114 family)